MIDRKNGPDPIEKELDQSAEKFFRMGLVTPEGIKQVKTVRVKIIKIPRGGAPEEVRRFWVGMELVAAKMTPDMGGEERNLVTGQAQPKREAYVVPTNYALSKLELRSKMAAEWFHKNVPPWFPVLSFGADELEIVSTK